MPMAPKSKQKTGRPLLELRLSHPASPRTVADAAQLIADVFEAAGPKLNAEAVTLVVSNLDLRARLFSYSKQGDKAIKVIAACLLKPEKSIANLVVARDIASCIIESGKPLLDYHPVLQRLDTKKKEEVELTRAYLKKLERLVDSAPRIGLRGTTTVVSPILRVGFVDEGRQLHARIFLEGKPKDVPVDISRKSILADEFKSGVPRRIKLDVQWYQDSDGTMKISPKTARIVDVDPVWQGTPGKDVAEAIGNLGGNLFEDPDQLLDDIGGI